MLTPSLVMVGAPHFFSSTTLRPLGPRVTLTASARVFMPRSSPRRASSLKAISFGMALSDSSLDRRVGGRRHRPRRTVRADPADPSRQRLRTSTPTAKVVVLFLSLSQGECQLPFLALAPSECKRRGGTEDALRRRSPHPASPPRRPRSVRVRDGSGCAR